MKDKEVREMLMKLTVILQKKKIIDDKDMEEMFGKPEEIRLSDCYKI